MGEKSRLFVNTLLENEELEQFFQVQRHYAIRSNSDVVRFLIRQEARRIAPPLNGDALTRVLAGYLGGHITAEEGMQEIVSRLGIAGVQLSIPMAGVLDVQNPEATR
ncbi:MAG: hypothetical protein JW900_07420 [Anaerolineae bacterium]|nr:hypothetical protein [Anaerolineae bacterium]